MGWRRDELEGKRLFTSMDGPYTSMLFHSIAI